MSFSRSCRAALAVAALLLAGLGTFAPQVHAQATRTWVSGVGDDANPCSRTAPCRTFAGTISKTSAGGEINALDPGAYGTLTVNKALTVDVTGMTGGVLNVGTNGIVVNAGATDDVILRGLDIYGANAVSPPTCVYGGLSGVRVLRARSVRIEDSRIGRQQTAIELAPTTPVTVLVNRVDIADNCTNGILAAPGTGGSVSLTVRGSTITDSGTGVSVSDGAAAWLTGTTLFGNALGLQALGTGTITDTGDNRLSGNAVDGAATTSLAVAGPPGPAGPAGPAGATGAAGAAGTPAFKLLVTASSARLSRAAGTRVRLRYAATAAGAGTLVVTRAGKRVASVRTTAKAGTNSVRWSGRIAGRPAPAGAYRLLLRVVGADGQIAVTNATLRLRAR